MENKRSSFATGKLIIGLVTILTGLQTLFSNQQDVLEQSLNEWRTTYLPNSNVQQRVHPDYKLTWEEFNQCFIKVEGFMLIAAGLLIILNKRCLGSFLLIFGISVMIALKDNPWRRHNTLKTKQREINERFNDFLQQVSLLGAGFILMLHKC